MSMPPPPEDQQARTQRHLAFLDTLIAHGMDLANRVHQQATNSPAEPETPETNSPAAPPIAPETIAPETIALFDQISRAVRRAILVSRKLAEPLPLAPAKPDPGRIAADRLAARKRIIREVEDTIHCKADPANADTLQAELHERVETIDLDDDIGNRPIPDIIADICRDLGITPSWEHGRFKRRIPRDLQTLNARAARPNTPAQPTESPDDAEAVFMPLQSSSKPDPRPPKHQHA